MRWFQKDRPPDVWEFATNQPLGDIGAAQKIREICASAGSIAETMAALRGRQAETHKASEAERYQAAVKCALELAKQISDDAMRDVSVSQIIALSVKAGHMKTATVLLRAIRSEKTQAELVTNHPPLIELSTDGPR
jgi:DNA-binding XRE family transcriptional regulator